MKTQLEREIIQSLSQYVDQEALETIKLELTMILNDYHVDQEERALTVYETDETVIVLKKFIAAKITKGCTPRTVNFYKTEAAKILRKIGKPYDQVTADDIRYYLAMRVQRDGVSKVTANSERRVLSSFYQWLQQEEILLKNPMSKIDTIKEEKKRKKAFSQMEVERIRSACITTRETAMVETLLSTWTRVSEITQIRIDEIEGERVVVHGKGEKDRDVYLTPKARLAIDKYLEDREDDNPYLFPKAKYAGAIDRFGGRKRSKEWYKEGDNVDEQDHMDTSSFEGVIRKIGKSAGVDNTHPHRFRRTGATMAFRAGMPLLQVSKLLGHSQIGTTQIYLDVSDEELMRAHERYVT